MLCFGSHLCKVCTETENERQTLWSSCVDDDGGGCCCPIFHCLWPVAEKVVDSMNEGRGNV